MSDSLITTARSTKPDHEFIRLRALGETKGLKVDKNCVRMGFKVTHLANGKVENFKSFSKLTTYIGEFQ